MIAGARRAGARADGAHHRAAARATRRRCAPARAWRSSTGVTVLNSPGTIDSDYRGEVRVILANLGQAPFEIRRGERIAQLVISPVTHAELIEVGEVSDTARGDGGFGSTGKRRPMKTPDPAKRH